MDILIPDPDYQEILLSRGMVAKVDAVDFSFLNQWKWSASKSSDKFYAHRCYRIDGVSKKVLMHRLILEYHGVNVSKLVVDHIDGNTLNNCFNNLRAATNTQNCRNSKGHVTRNSKYKCVCPNGKDGWMAYIMVNRQRIYLGTYGTPEEAALVYNQAATKYFGEFANLNQLPDALEISSSVNCQVCGKNLRRDANYPYCVQHRHLRPGYRGRKSQRTTVQRVVNDSF